MPWLWDFPSDSSKLREKDIEMEQLAIKWVNKPFQHYHKSVYRSNSQNLGRTQFCIKKECGLSVC